MKEIVKQTQRFRQIKKDVRNNKDYLMIGIDVGKRTCVACLADGQKNIFEAKLAFPNNRDGLSKLLSKIKSVQDEDFFRETLIALEPTANYHKPLCGTLHQQGFAVCYISGVGASQNRKSLDGRWRKNDPMDAYNLVDMMSQGKVLQYTDPTGSFSELRELTTLRNGLTVQLNRCKVQIRNNHLARFFPEMDEIYEDILCPEAVQILRNFPTAEDIRHSSFDVFRRKVTKTIDIKSQNQERLYKVWQEAQRSIGCPRNPAIKMHLKVILQGADLIKKQINKVDEMILESCQGREDFELLQTIPGIGPQISSQIIAVIRDIDLFASPRQLIKLAGLDLEQEQSGDYLGRSRISRKGLPLLRYAMFQAANGAIRTEAFKGWYQSQLKRKGEQSGIRKILKIKLSAKLLRICFAVLKNKEPFQIDRLNPVGSLSKDVRAEK